MKNAKLPIRTAAAIALATLAASCSKYPDGPSVSLRSAESRVVGEWEVVNIGKTAELQTDVTFEFEKNGDYTATYTYHITEDGQAYTDVDAVKGEWELDDDNQTLVLKVNRVKTEYDILRLTSKQMLWEEAKGEKREWLLEAK